MSAPLGRLPRALASAVLAAVLVPSLLRAADAAAEFALQETWQAFFGGKETVLHVSLGDALAARGRVGWSLRAQAGTILSGEQAFEAGAGRAATVAIPVALPPVKEGTIVPVDFEARAFPPGQAQPAATLSRRLWLFPEDPFANRLEWLRGLRLRLFDPEGHTEKCFTQAKVPFESVTNLAAIEGEAPVVLVIGAGTSGRTYEDHAATLVRLAAQGHRVLTLQVSGAEFALPGSAEPDLPQPMRVEWRQADVIAELDKRLDATAWPPDGTLPAGLMQIATRGAQVTGRLGPEPPGWPWFAAHLASGGRLLVCGFPIIERWEAGPTPRFLFVRILEWLAKTEPEQKDVTPQAR
jgi:hypothetical protein